jgi:hypothetical protein
MKKLIKLVLVLVILLIVGVVGAYFYIDAITKTAIEHGSTHALGVNTTLNSASLRILQGQLVMGGLNVSNPTGYNTAHFLNMKDGDVAVSLGSLTKEIVEVPHIRLSDIDLNLEKKDGKANYQVILDNLKRGETSPPPDKTDEEGKRFIVKELSIKNVNVHLEGIGPLGKKIDVPIDAIELNNVGSDTGKGVLLKDLSGVIVKAIFAAIVKNGGGLIPADIAGELTNGLAQLTDISKIADVEKLGELIKPLENLPADLGEKLGEDIKGAGEAVKEGIGGAIGDLLGGKKDEK